MERSCVKQFLFILTLRVRFRIQYMIPDIIHYCWFSGEKMPQSALDCMESWRRFMPECEIRLWDMDAVRGIDNRFMREALEHRKWAFATDYVRLYAVESCGGIYMDTDVMLYGSLRPYMDDRMFIGREMVNIHHSRTVMTLTSHLFGAEAHHPFLKACLSYYDGRAFVTSDNASLPMSLRYDVRTMPLTQALVAEWAAGYDPSPRITGLTRLADGMTVHPMGLFCGGRNAVARHLMSGSWRDVRLGEAQEGRVPLWRRAMGTLGLRPAFERLLWRLGYMAVKL